MGRESKNYISGSRHSRGKVTFFTCIVLTVITTLITLLCLWSYQTCVRLGLIFPEKGAFAAAIEWLSVCFKTPLCWLDGNIITFWAYNSYIVILADLTVIFLVLSLRKPRGEFDRVQHGSAHWATRRELKPFRHEDGSMPLADGVYLTSKVRPANKNVFVLAAPGGGKSFRVIIPAIEALTRDGLQGSFFCTDTKGALYRDTAKMVRDRGLQVYLLNLSDPWFSHRYNPLDNIHEERKVTEIAKLALAYAKNVRDEEAGVGDSIWEDTFKQLICAVWFYQYDFSVNPLTKRPETRALWRTAELIKGLRISGKGRIDESCELARIVAEIRKTDPLHPTLGCYDFVAAGAAETVASVIFTAGSKVSVFTYPEIESLTRKNDIDIDTLISEPSGVYLNFEVGSPYKAIAALFIEQLFSSAYFLAETKYGGALPRPLKLFLDELPNICRVHSLPERASTSRSYNIDLVISVQSMQQLQHIFKDAEKTLMNNCVTHIYLGTGEADALKQISEALGKTTTEETSDSRSKGMSGHGGGSESDRFLGREIALPSEIYSMPDLYAIVKIQHHPPIFAEKFKTEKQSYYKLLGGQGNPRNSCIINEDFREQRLLYMAEYESEKRMRISKILEEQNL